GWRIATSRRDRPEENNRGRGQRQIGIVRGLLPRLIRRTIARNDEKHSYQMGFLTFFSKAEPTQLVHLPSGSFTIDREGTIMTSTLPQSFPASRMQDIGEQVIASFQ